MTAAYGVSWNDGKAATRAAALAMVALMAAAFVVPAGSALSAAGSRMVSVIVRAVPGTGSGAEHAVHEVNGHVGQRIGIINGFAARVPARDIARVQVQPGVASITPNAKGHLLSTTPDYSEASDGYSISNVTKAVGAQDYWKAGYTGTGVGVALIDSGVAPVQGLTTQGKLIDGPDLSFESQAPGLAHIDTYGHGTHMAGIIGGRDDAATPATYVGDTANFIGMAPDAHIVNIKVADASGATDVSQVIAAIDWVVQHKDDNGLNIRVLNLSFGTDSKQSYLLDPLTFAAEVAWRKGIVVVAAAGNTGQVGLTDPASDPFVIAVGATDTKAEPNGLVTDAVAPYSSLGNGLRNPDTVAPGSHIQSLRDPGSYLDQHYGGTGQINDRFFRGSGTSQAAALVSGGAALIVQQHPDYTPDQIKYLLTNNTSGITGARAASAGKGRISLDRTLHASLFKNKAAQMFVPANGWGSLDGARGTAKLMRDGVELTGNVDIFGHAFNSAAIATAELTGNSWSGGDWNGNSWSGNSWSGNSWSGNSWSGNSWSGNSWSGNSWSGNSWSGNSWSGNSWSGNSWSGVSWSGNTWSSDTWV